MVMEIEKILEKEKINLPEVKILLEASLQTLLKMSNRPLCLDLKEIKEVAANIHTIYNKFLKPLDTTLDDIAASLEKINQQIKNHEA